jgi:hypothetical protein
MKESEIQRAILDYLAARHILAFRQNTGAVASEYKGKKRFMRFGTPGMADILAFPSEMTVFGFVTDGVNLDPRPVSKRVKGVFVLWIECKAVKGKQSELQKSFQAQVEEAGHHYLVARSVEDVEAVL